MNTDFKYIFNNIDKLENKDMTFIGRVRSNRSGKNISFISLFDGTTFEDIQVVLKSDCEGFIESSNARISSIVEVTGKLIKTEGKKQSFEISASKFVLLDKAIEEYPLQKKEHSLEFLREIAHLRGRTKTFNAVFKIRSSASFAIHQFFNQEGFLYAQTPILTSNDAEGAGEQFLVSTSNEKKQNEFFGKQASLTVSGQLNAEAFAQAFRKVYTFGPTFRAENSHTNRHASEFWMVEPEVAFSDINDNIKLMENMLKFVVSHVLKNNVEELNFLEENLEEGLINKISGIVNSNFKTNTYEEVLEILKTSIQEGHVFEENNIYFGMDLKTEHERFICEKINNCPTFVINYPKEIKSFYMKLNQDNKTVAGVDLLVPGIGELCGGSQREDSYENLIKRCEELGINHKDLDWYINLRQYGYYKSSGFGLGFERLIMYITGVSNIRDVCLYPRTPNNLLF